MLSLTPTGFDSYHHYFQFVFAKEFRLQENHDPFVYSKSVLEHVGGILAKPFTGFTDFSLKNIRNPLFITSLALTAICGVTILFYPDRVVQWMERFIPVVLNVKPWMIKAGFYTAIQSVILGIGLRTLGRLNNAVLWEAWTTLPRRIIPISLGTVVVRVS